MRTDQGGSFEFGIFRLDATERRLLREGYPVALTPKAFHTLVLLVENRGHVLRKDELIGEVWPDTFVDEGGLARNISVLRKALGDDPVHQRLIETVPKRGYRFVGNVRTLLDRSSAQSASEPHQSVASHPAAQLPRFRPMRRWAVWALSALVLVLATTSAISRYSRDAAVRPIQAADSRRLVAVLPFEPWNAESDPNYLGLGLADAVITRLSRIGRITVRPTSAISKHGQGGVDPLRVARELGVHTVVVGKVSQVAGRIRVRVQVLTAPGGEILWAGTFDETVRDVFTVEDAISQRVAEALQITLTGEEHRRLKRHDTDSAPAYDAYLNGRYLANQRTPEMLTEAVVLFEKAIAIDSEFARAHAGLADCFALLAVYHALPPHEAFEKAKLSARRALAIDDTIAEAHTTLGFVATLYEWDWSRGEAAFRRAIMLSPSYATARHWYAINLMSAGRVDESIAQILEAQVLDPVSPIISTDVAEMFYWAGQYGRAIEQAQTTLELHPHYHMAHGLRGWAYAQNGQPREALSEFRKALAAADQPGTRLGIGYVAALTHDTMEARRTLEELTRLSATTYVSPHHFAVMHAALGDTDKATDWLETAFDARVVQLNWLKMDPRFRGLHGDGRFQALVKRLRFP
jgi:DNA-binding winged helix-turn-helix (wHTH) protein/TolB-like protein/Flp pilus assembly protein TadD